MFTLMQRLLMMLLALVAISAAVLPSASFAGPSCGSNATVANEDEEDEGEDDGEDGEEEEEERA